MPAPNFDPKAYHELVCGVSGVAFEQNGCYYNIRQEYVKPSGRKRTENLIANVPTAARPGRPKPLTLSTVPDTIVDVSRENEKAQRAEQAAT